MTSASRCALITVLILAPGTPFADPPARRLYLGGGISWISTIDEIRSNAAIMNSTRFGDDGIPHTGDPNEPIGCGDIMAFSFPIQDPFCDPRPDDLVARAPSIEEGFGFSATIGFQVTRRFALQFDAGYFRGNAGDFDVYEEKTIPFVFQGEVLGFTDTPGRSTVLSAGEITEIPLALSGIFRFRPGEKFGLLLGAGLGRIDTRLEMNDEIMDLNETLSRQRIRIVADEIGTTLIPSDFRFQQAIDEGLIVYPYPLSVGVENAFEWHLLAGLEYGLGDRVSLVFEGRYTFANRDIILDLEEEDQVNLITWPDEMYHPNGSLRIFSPDGGPPNPLCFVVPNGVGCGQNPPHTKRINPADAGITCPASGDFDRNGLLDFCYPVGLRSPGGNNLQGLWVIQGGTIDLTAFTLGLKVRIFL